MNKETIWSRKDRERALIVKSKEIYFHKTLSYIEKLSDKALKNEEEKIKNEFKLKEEFLNNFDKEINRIIKLYEESFPLFVKAAVFLKKNCKQKIIEEESQGFFLNKVKKKVDLIISKDSANQFLKLYCEAHEKLYEAFMENTKLASNGLYNKIRMKFSPYYPTEKHYNNELILDDDINFNCLPKRLVQRDMNAMGDLITTKKMFSFISPGLSNFEAEDLGFNKVVTVSKDPYKQVFGYEYYTEKAMNFFYELQSRKAAIKVNEACYFAVTMIPLKKYYKELFKKEIDIRNKQLRKIELVKRSREKGRKKIENVGYVYVLKSIGYPGLYKIGSTYGLVEERAEELSGTNVPDPWMPAGKIKLKNAEYYEKQIHKLLKDSRYRKGREFFKVDLSKIKDCFKKVSELSDKGEKKLTISDLKKGIKI